MDKSEKGLFINKLFNADVVCAEFYPLFLCVSGHLPSNLTELIRESEDVCNLLGIDDSNYKEISSCNFHDAENLLIDMGKTGFLARFQTPYPNRMSKNENGWSWSASWGWTKEKWFYAESIDELVSKAVQWAAEVVEKEKAKHLKSMEQQDNSDT